MNCQSKSKLCYDRWYVGQSVLVSSTHPELTTRFLLLSDSCGFVDVGRSLWRERVCRLQLLLVLASAVILGSESRGTRDHILLSQIRVSPNLEGQIPVFIYPRNRVVQLYPQALGSLFVAFYDLQSYGGGIRTRLHVRLNCHLLSASRFIASGPLPSNGCPLLLRIRWNVFT
jgi:hypothetical protein